MFGRFVTVYVIYSVIKNEKDMRLQNLISALERLEVQHEIVSYNELNKYVQFNINGKIFQADFNQGENIVRSLCADLGFNGLNQERNRKFFPSLAQLIRYANR